MDTLSARGDTDTLSVRGDTDTLSARGVKREMDTLSAAGVKERLTQIYVQLLRSCNQCQRFNLLLTITVSMLYMNRKSVYSHFFILKGKVRCKHVLKIELM